MPRTPKLADAPRDVTVKQIPPEIFNAIARLAEAHHRPLRGEIIVALEHYAAFAPSEAAVERTAGRPAKTKTTKGDA